MALLNEGMHVLVITRRKTEVFEVMEDRRAVQKTHGHSFTEGRWCSGHSKVDIFTRDFKPNPTILRKSFFQQCSSQPEFSDEK